MKVFDHLNKCFPLTTKEGSTLDNLNHKIAQSSSFITLDQTLYMISFTKACLKFIKNVKTDTPFLTIRQVEDGIDNATAYGSIELEKLVAQYGEF